MRPVGLTCERGKRAARELEAGTDVPAPRGVAMPPASHGQALAVTPQSLGHGRDARSNFANRAVRKGILGDGRPNCAFGEVEPPIGWQGGHGRAARRGL